MKQRRLKLKHILNNAKHEIVTLRRENEILRAKVEMIELFALVLHTKPAHHSQGMGEDIVWKISKHLEEMAKEESRNGAGAESQLGAS
jgi:hypothetical protein